MKKVIGYAAAAATTALMPVLAFAQVQQGNSTFGTGTINNILVQFKGIVNTALIVLAGVAVIVFIVGIIRFVLASADAEKRGEARGYMIYAVIAFAVIAGLYGLANALLNFFNISSGDTLVVPQIKP